MASRRRRRGDARRHRRLPRRRVKACRAPICSAGARTRCEVPGRSSRSARRRACAPCGRCRGHEHASARAERRALGATSSGRLRPRGCGTTRPGVGGRPSGREQPDAEVRSARACTRGDSQTRARATPPAARARRGRFVAVARAEALLEGVERRIFAFTSVPPRRSRARRGCAGLRCHASGLAGVTLVHAAACIKPLGRRPPPPMLQSPGLSHAGLPWCGARPTFCASRRRPGHGAQTERRAARADDWHLRARCR